MLGRGRLRLGRGRLGRGRGRLGRGRLGLGGSRLGRGRLGLGGGRLGRGRLGLVVQAVTHNVVTRWAEDARGEAPGNSQDLVGSGVINKRMIGLQRTTLLHQYLDHGREELPSLQNVRVDGSLDCGPVVHSAGLSVLGGPVNVLGEDRGNQGSKRKNGATKELHFYLLANT